MTLYVLSTLGSLLTSVLMTPYFLSTLGVIGYSVCRWYCVLLS